MENIIEFHGRGKDTTLAVYRRTGALTSVKHTVIDLTRRELVHLAHAAEAELDRIDNSWDA